MNVLNITVTWSIVGIMLCAVALSIIVHETGHWLYIYRKRGIRMKFKIYKESWKDFGIRQFDPTGELTKNPLTDRELQGVLTIGILFGAVPIIFGWIILVGVTLLGWFLIPGYLAGCRRDFTKLLEVVEKQTKELNARGGIDGTKRT